MYLGDNLLRDGITGLVEAFRRNEPDALILLTPVPDPEHYGVAELDGERIVRLVEKPAVPPSDLALVGVYMFTSEVFAAARAIEPSPRGELEITDTIQHLIDTGHTVEHHRVKGWWKDTGQLADMLEANRLVLEDLELRIEGELIDSKVEGRVAIDAGARVERSTVRGPAVIGSGSTIIDSYVGPYTSIGSGCEGVNQRGALDPVTGRDQRASTRMERALGSEVRIARAVGMTSAADEVGDASEDDPCGHRRRRRGRLAARFESGQRRGTRLRRGRAQLAITDPDRSDRPRLRTRYQLRRESDATARGRRAGGAMTSRHARDACRRRRPRRGERHLYPPISLRRQAAAPTSRRPCGADRRYGVEAGRAARGRSVPHHYVRNLL